MEDNVFLVSPRFGPFCFHESRQQWCVLSIQCLIPEIPIFPTQLLFLAFYPPGFACECIQLLFLIYFWATIPVPNQKSYPKVSDSMFLICMCDSLGSRSLVPSSPEYILRFATMPQERLAKDCCRWLRIPSAPKYWSEVWMLSKHLN